MNLDPEVLDELARCYAQAAVEALVREIEAAQKRKPAADESLLVSSEGRERADDTPHDEP